MENWLFKLAKDWPPLSRSSALGRAGGRRASALRLVVRFLAPLVVRFLARLLVRVPGGRLPLLLRLEVSLREAHEVAGGDNSDELLVLRHGKAAEAVGLDQACRLRRRRVSVDRDDVLFHEH